MKKSYMKKLVAKPEKKHKVSDFNTDFTGDLDKEDCEALLRESVEAMIKIQDVFYADNRYSVLLVFQAMDAAGKDGTIKHVMSGLNPQGSQVFSFKQPSAEELDHDFMWRILKCLPERGRIGIFNRSHYEEVLVTKIHPEILLNQQLPGIESVDDINDKFWKKRYRQINDIERYLSENGTIILKFFLNVSKEEQKKRFLERLNEEDKNWKFSLSDIKERKHWDEYMKAYSDVFTHTSTEYAPWYIIPADQKWFMRYAVSKIIVERLEELDLQYPRLTPSKRNEIIEGKQLLEAED